MINERSNSRLEQARKIRESEKAKYLAINSSVYVDAEQRWDKYEQLILNKYYLGEYPIEDRQQAIDKAWIERDKRHSRS